MHLTPEIIGAFADGELAVAERQAARRHLDECAVCRQEVAELERLAGWVGSLQHAPSADFEAKMLARLQEMPMPRLSLWMRFRLSPARIPALAAIALVVLGYGGYTARQHQQALRMQEAAAANAAEEISVAEQADFLENVDMLEDLDALEALDGTVPG
jgi:anti-sigma factor RsiW